MEDIKEKPVHVKPALYAFYYERLKVIAKGYGYNLVLHGSMNRDLDLILIPWQKVIGDIDDLMKHMADVLGGELMIHSDAQKYSFPHGRYSYIININRGKWTIEDPQYYLDISVIPHKLNTDTMPAEMKMLKERLFAVKETTPQGLKEELMRIANEYDRIMLLEFIAAHNMPRNCDGTSPSNDQLREDIVWFVFMQLTETSV